MSFIPSLLSKTDSGNSYTNASFTSGTTYNGTATNTDGYTSVTVNVYFSNVSSSTVTGFLYLNFSTTSGGTFEQSKGYECFGSFPNSFVFDITHKYYKVTYTNNSGTTMADLAIQSILKVNSGTTTIVGSRNGGGKSIASTTSILGQLEVSVTNPITSFGEVSMAENSTVFQGDYIYGINSEIYKKIINGTTVGTAGTVASSNNFAKCSTTANASCLGYLQTNACLRYRSGQGSMLRFSALWEEAGAVGNDRYAGGGNFKSGIYFGYKGANFGVSRFAGGTLAIQSLGVTGTSSANNITITLYDGSTARVFTISSISASLTAETVAGIIGSFDYTTLYPGWIASSNGSKVTFVCMLAQPNNTVTGTQTGGVTLAGTSDVPGVVPNGTTDEEFVAQSSWNIDTMDGSGNSKNPSGVLLDVTKGNVYQINLQYLGVGSTLFSIENPRTGVFQPVHKVLFANKNSVVNLKNPNLFFQMFSRNTSNTTALSVSGASNYGCIQGKITNLGVQRNFMYSLTNTISATNKFAFALRPAVIYASGVNIYSTVTICPISLIICGPVIPTGGNGTIYTPIQVEVRLDPTYTYGTTPGTIWFENASNTNVLIASSQVTGPVTTASNSTAASGGVQIFSVILSYQQVINIDLTQYNLQLGVFDTLAVNLTFPVGSTAPVTSSYSVSMNWIENS